MGPVHLNVPFREPLVPAPDEMAACEARGRTGAALRAAVSTRRRATRRGGRRSRALAALAARLDKAQRPLLVAGPEAVRAAEAAAVLALARAAGMPVFADIASGLRGGACRRASRVCALADLFLRDEALAALAPDFVLRLGGIPTSKTLATWLARHRPPLVAIQPDERRRDPDGIVGEVVVGPAPRPVRGARPRARTGSARRGWASLLRRRRGRRPRAAAAGAARSGRRRCGLRRAARRRRALPVEQHAHPLGGDVRAGARATASRSS